MPRHLLYHWFLPPLGRGSGRLWRKRLLVPILALTVFAVVATVGYWLIQKDYSFLDALYMTVITVGTVGYGEVGGGLSTGGRIWSIVVIVMGMVIVAVALSGIVALLVEGQVRGLFGRRQLERKIGKLSGHVIVCGYGQMGALVASKLLEGGQCVVVVDNDTNCTAAAEEAGMLYVLGDAQEEATLLAAGVERAEALVSALPTDADNVFVTLSAREANADVRIVSRAQQASAEDKLRKAGASRVICAQLIGAGRMARVVLQPAVVDFVEMTQTGEGLEIEQLRLAKTSAVVGKRISELELPRRAGVHIVAVQRPGEHTVLEPHAEMRLAAGDTLILIGKAGAAGLVERFQQEVPDGDQA